jgi:hypothetical protein
MVVEYSLHKVSTGFYAVATIIFMPACKVCMPACKYRMQSLHVVMQIQPHGKGSKQLESCSKGLQANVASREDSVNQKLTHT